ncbi:GNAT family N-acetyltransferase [Fibrella aestuarina]|uniref:GNAT family N-acetyltransferase n=1 Tax=Fibrella aestuarina TaxID=651143 RepID=UPI00031FAA5A|nr:GNAT family N-acetyltransferase [Fibrella aestuarina]
MLVYQTHTTLPPEPLLSTLLDLLTAVFANQSRAEWLDDLTRKATHPAFQLLLALDGQRVVGCKIGYEWQSGTFYSWLGGVDPAWRGRGIAAELMCRQHDACRLAGYVTIRTHTYNQWRSMLILNIRHGFDVVGTQPGKHGLTIMLEKPLRG